MLLNITTTHNPATDLGYLLHKHPDRFQTIELSVGKAHIFYPLKSESRTTVSLLLDIDPIDLVRGTRPQGKENFVLAQYVNDRPYVASSFLSVAIAKAFSSALNGKCKDRPELAEQALPFEVTITSLPAPKGGETLIRQFFEPLGYSVTVQRHILDNTFPDWGESKYYTLTLGNTLTTRALLSHLYVLIPALDNDKHYFISKDEIEKLLQKGEGWLLQHPEKEQITRRYLIHLSALSRLALERLKDEATEPEEPQEPPIHIERLHDQRLNMVANKLLETGAGSVIDLGCGEGKLLKLLLKQKQFTRISGMDVSYGELLKAKENLHYDSMPLKQKERIELFQGSLMYKDKRLAGYDAATVVEVIEHLELNRLRAFERVLFEFARPKTVIITTPNKEYNVMWKNFEEGDMRHSDHRFEWTRAEFADWAQSLCAKYQYTVTFLPVGLEDEQVGAPTQMAIFTYGN